MAYIGKTPTIGNFQVCDAISVVNNQAAYTMQVGGVNVSPESANHMLVSLNGILQAPTSSFTVSGSTITFASNLVTGDVIDFIQILGNVLDLGVPSDNTVTTAKLADSSVSLAKLTATGTKDATTFLRGDNTFDVPPLGGITVADNWRLTTSFTGDADPIASNWERTDDATFGYIGSGMSQSSGIFTFPSTGIYRVAFTFAVYSANSSGDDRAPSAKIRVSSDSGSSYDDVAQTHNFVTTISSSFTHNQGTTSTFVDVTNASNFRVKFSVTVINANTSTFGQSDKNQTFAEFIRLGDT
jgi:hypothetical protein